MKAPHEFKIMRVRECVAPAKLVDTPERAFEYWKANIPQAPWFDENKEAFVVLILNTRRYIIDRKSDPTNAPTLNAFEFFLVVLPLDFSLLT